ncbi:hypothetical protein [Ruegeria atlantica]|uniref:hypothetical protein n=1 Tax=Ruegeria atlantica TaxID=81569 RepID=UPI0034A0A930
MTIGKRISATLIACLGAAAPLEAAAQTRISPEAFLAAVMGKTVDFHDFHSGEIVGTEEFLSSTVSVWRREGRGCVYGQITTPNGQICFLYDDEIEGPAVCWWPFEYEGRLMVRLATLANSEIQEVRRITTEGLNCPSAPIS